MENLGNDFATTLAAAIVDTIGTAITVASGTGAPSASFRIRIDDELLLVTSTGAGTNWTVERGAEGSTAATHLNAAAVAHVVTTEGLARSVFEGAYAAYPGVESGKVRLVATSHKLNVLEELIVEGELIVDGEVRVMPLP